MMFSNKLVAALLCSVDVEAASADVANPFNFGQRFTVCEIDINDAPVEPFNNGYGQGYPAAPAAPQAPQTTQQQVQPQQPTNGAASRVGGLDFTDLLNKYGQGGGQQGQQQQQPTNGATSMPGGLDFSNLLNQFGQGGNQPGGKATNAQLQEQMSKFFGNMNMPAGGQQAPGGNNPAGLDFSNLLNQFGQGGQQGGGKATNAQLQQQMSKFFGNGNNNFMGMNNYQAPAAVQDPQALAAQVLKVPAVYNFLHPAAGVSRTEEDFMNQLMPVMMSDASVSQCLTSRECQDAVMASSDAIQFFANPNHAPFEQKLRAFVAQSSTNTNDPLTPWLELDGVRNALNNYQATSENDKQMAALLDTDQALDVLCYPQANDKLLDNSEIQNIFRQKKNQNDMFNAFAEIVDKKYERLSGKTLLKHHPYVKLLNEDCRTWLQNSKEMAIYYEEHRELLDVLENASARAKMENIPATGGTNQMPDREQYENNQWRLETLLQEELKPLRSRGFNGWGDDFNLNSLFGDL